MTSNRKNFRLGAWLPVLVVAGAVGLGWGILKSGPTTEPIEEKRLPKTVKTIAPEPGTYRRSVTAYGSVIPARTVTIEPQVTGNIVRLHPNLRPGGFVNEGEELFAIDPMLAELNLKETRADAARAEVLLAEAKRKWQEGRRLADEMVIPETELAALDAAVKIQEADLERLQAGQSREEELFQRHSVRAPFNIAVLEESVELGQRVAPGDATATLVGTDEFWVRASLPTDLLRWVRRPTAEQPGAEAKLLLDTGGGQTAEYAGEVLQLLTDLEETGRMARVLIRVRDPLRRGQAPQSLPLLLGSYLRVEIDAGLMENVLAIDRTAFREGDRIWVVDASGRLQIREVEVRWRKDETVYIDPVLEPGETLVVSDLRVALPNMEVNAQPADRPEPARLPGSDS